MYKGCMGNVYMVIGMAFSLVKETLVQRHHVKINMAIGMKYRMAKETFVQRLL